MRRVPSRLSKTFMARNFTAGLLENIASTPRGQLLFLADKIAQYDRTLQVAFGQRAHSVSAQIHGSPNSPLQLGSQSRRRAPVYTAGCLCHADQRMCVTLQICGSQSARRIECPAHRFIARCIKGASAGTADAVAMRRTGRQAARGISSATAGYRLCACTGGTSRGLSLVGCRGL